MLIHFRLTVANVARRSTFCTLFLRQQATSEFNTASLNDPTNQSKVSDINCASQNAEWGQCMVQVEALALVGLDDTVYPHSPFELNVHYRAHWTPFGARLIQSVLLFSFSAPEPRCPN